MADHSTHHQARVTLPYPRQPKYGQGERQAVLRLLDRGKLSETGRGEATAALEDAFAEMTGTPHVLSFNSGTAALHAAVHAVADPDQDVAVSPMTWISAITAVLHAGRVPVLCDLEPDSPNLDPAEVASRSDRIGAVVATHTWGIPARVDELTHASGRPVIEDCSHAHGALYRHRPVGAWGAAGAFSVQESKAVSGGEGGVLTTTDRAVYERAMVVGHHPHRLAAELSSSDLLALAETGMAHKFRMPALSAAIAREQLRGLPERSAAASANLATLLGVLDHHAAPITVPALDEGSVRGWYGTPLIITEPVTDPTELFQRVTDAGVPLRALYPDWAASPLLRDPDLLHRCWPHVHPGRYTPADPRDFPNYYRARRQLLVLKVPYVLAPDYMEQVAHTLVDVLTRFLTKGA
ncbi:DegT/DnrJ/EryC1/StrS family aminotransferase [Nocardiopsis tropica]|uniref:DegT/DnrJ/EryC1/StrS family aminotransferase n=1 Tax=Nocardiopsis tropica TaxID=109330 RepID=A0ABU7KN35_9ACTN|nr:DegT/DnrJ/EryC1/StrS family aminotransferase [Nocardiopsis umidischolae]MEE2050661.1 DegT/DnrJ/EryC1/StrS family aminotransferase [Nocardiopsis umidischolae]